MLAHQRHELIVQYLRQHRQARVAELVNVLDSSEATIRRDLQELEHQNRLQRVHGGALAIDDEPLFEATITERSTAFPMEKSAIAQTVAPHLADVRVLFLDAGSSTAAIIPLLDATRITVVTNGAHHVNGLMEQGVPTILLGGRVKPTTQAILGASAVQQLSEFAFDCALLGMNGIDVQFGLSTPDLEEAQIKKTAIQNARRTFVLADHSKFHHRSFCHVAPLSAVTIVTDVVPDDFTSLPNIWPSHLS